MAPSRLWEPQEWRPDWPERVRAGLLGAAVGDALGLPWEFVDKETVRRLWRGDMVGGGTWGQPPGTWSDDTGQMLAVAHGLVKSRGDPVTSVARELIRWYTGEAHTLGGPPFDVGLTTSKALERLLRGVPPDRSGVERPSCGSLMRNLPVALITLCEPLPSALELAHRVSRITHAHPVAEMACGLHLVMARGLMAGLTLWESIGEAAMVLREYYASHPRYQQYTREFAYLHDMSLLQAEPQTGSCKANETLQGALWALTTSSSFREALVRAVSLGGDTDTLGTVTGGLAGIIRGLNSIPRDWLEALRGGNQIEYSANALTRTLHRKCSTVRR